MNSSSQDCRKAIVELNEQLSKLNMVQKVKALDPKVEKAIQYYKSEKEKVMNASEKTIKGIDAKIENATRKADREKKDLDEKLAAFTEKIERQKKDIDNALELTVEKIERQIKDEKKAVDDKMVYYDQEIQKREGPTDDPVHELKKAEILKNRDWQLKLLKEHEENEAYLQRCETNSKNVVRGKRQFFYNGKTYDSQDLVNAVIAKEIAEHQKQDDEDEEMKRELEERRKEDELYEKRIKELERLERIEKINETDL